MKRFILVTNSKMVDALEDLGFSSLGIRDLGNGQIAIQFPLTDALYRTLKDKSKFSRKYWFEDSKLTF